MNNVKVAQAIQAGQVSRQPIEMEDPTFLPGSLHTAYARMTVSPTGISCTIELYLSLDGGITKKATTTPIVFTSTGAIQDVTLPLTMPAVYGNYGVFVDFYVAGTLYGLYQATANVVIPSVTPPVITW